MDLAKIRKKYLQTLDCQDDEQTTVSLEQRTDAPETVQVVSLTAAVSSLQKESSPLPLASVITSLPLITAAHPLSRSPLEAILAGRSAAGCDEDVVLADDFASIPVEESYLEFLCFRVSAEIYGINIMDIKEIIKPREVTEVPRAPIFISGVLSLRGTIIPIIDMRARLGLACEETTGKERIVVIKNNNSMSGLLVDEVIQVVRVKMDAIEAAPAVLDGIDREFVSGLGRSEGRLIIVLNLESIADINLC